MTRKSKLFENEPKPEKFFPEVGTHLYLSQITGDGWVDMVKRPYTVIRVDKKHVYIQGCKLVFNGPRYYDTLPDDIKEDINGEVLVLNWAPKKHMWQVDKYNTGYPSYAYFGEWCYSPYLN